ncbi:MAG: hypothetical protein ABR976_04045 [Terracidiphilus sp.]|jgi:hypothetical protein
MAGFSQGENADRATELLGAQVTGYGVPARLLPLYRRHPVGVAAVLGVRLGKGER